MGGRPRGGWIDMCKWGVGGNVIRILKQKLRNVMETIIKMPQPMRSISILNLLGRGLV